MDSQIFDLLKAIAGPLAGVGLAWLVGNRISAEWGPPSVRRRFLMPAWAPSTPRLSGTVDVSKLQRR